METKRKDVAGVSEILRPCLFPILHIITPSDKASNKHPSCLINVRERMNWSRRQKAGAWVAEKYIMHMNNDWMRFMHRCVERLRGHGEDKIRIFESTTVSITPHVEVRTQNLNFHVLMVEVPHQLCPLVAMTWICHQQWMGYCIDVICKQTDNRLRFWK